MTVGGPTRVIAHRGFSSRAPENTRAAVARSIEVGADMVEVDVTMTADGRVICLHDETLDRTTDGRGPATSRTLDEIRRLDAGSWFSPEFAGEPVPTLDEVLDLVDGRALLNIEIKPEAVPHGAVNAVAELVRRRDLVDRVVVSSFAPEALRRMKIVDPDIVTVSLFNADLHKGRDPLEIIQEVGSRGLNLARHEVTAEIIERCHRHGFPVGVYTVNRKQGMRRVMRLKADAVFTDHPDRLIEVQRSEARRTADEAR